MRKVLITGASGYVGRHTAKALFKDGWSVCLAKREVAESSHGKVVFTGSIGASTDWRLAVEGCDTVVHLAARAPFQPGNASYEDVNVGATEALVSACRSASVRTFVFISSLAVYGEHSSSTEINDTSPIRPSGEYAETKMRAEEIVASFSSPERTAVVLRPPLIYGKEAKGNWRALEKLVTSGLPLPLAAIHNRRSMIYIDNLVSAILQVATVGSPEKSGSYIVCDLAPVSLRVIVDAVRRGMGVETLNFPVPALLMSTLLRVIGKGAVADSLFGDLIADGSRFNSVFDWKPPFTSEDALESIGHEFARERKGD